MDRRVVKLLQKEQYKQKTEEWYNERKNLITASSASNLLVKDDKTCDPYIKTYGLEDIFDKNGKCCNPYSSKQEYISEKINKSSFKGNIATYWGQKYEQVAIDLYSNLTGKNVLDFGLIKHPNHRWLASSPDGITNDGIMVEIKCPFRRKITGIPPFYYWIQVQLQLEVCNLDYCDFVEYEFMEFDTEEEFLDEEILDIKTIYKGLFIKIEKTQFTNEPCDPSEMTYIYPDKNKLKDTVKLIEWKNEILKQNKNDKFLKYSPIYWKVVDSSIVRIKKDYYWFSSIVNTLEKEWKNIMNQKTSMKEITYNLNKIKKENTCIFSDDEF